ncbi:MAG: acetyl-CoA carboxylase biotin carboxyl carrier protein [Treponema sp.]
MKETFILELLEKFEKGASVFLHIKDGDTEFTLKKEAAFRYQESLATPQPLVYTAPTYIGSNPTGTPAPQGGASQGTPYAAASQATQIPQTSNAPQDSPTQNRDTTLVHIKSPLVGTFYRSPSPDAPPYVDKGTTVKKGQPLCILEAMKMMNTLESEFDGTIEDILITNGDLVEFDQHIFTIRVDA